MNLSRIFGFLFVALAFTMAFFSMWQLDMMFVQRMWSGVDDNIGFYTALKRDGYGSFSAMPWTINVELFPDMRAGEAYDLLMIMNLSALPALAIGVYLVVSRGRRAKASS